MIIAHIFIRNIDMTLEVVVSH